MKTLGLIGFGQFGQLAAGVLKDHFDVMVADADYDRARRLLETASKAAPDE